MRDARISASAVALGAFGAHGLKSAHASYPKDQAAYYQDVWKTASSYHLLHSAVLTFSPAITKATGLSTLSAKCFIAGTVLFSGSLYALVVTENKKFGAIAPIGGFALIAGWIALAMGV